MALKRETVRKLLPASCMSRHCFMQLNNYERLTITVFRPSRILFQMAYCGRAEERGRARRKRRKRGERPNLRAETSQKRTVQATDPWEEKLTLSVQNTS